MMTRIIPRSLSIVSLLAIALASDSAQSQSEPNVSRPGVDRTRSPMEAHARVPGEFQVGDRVIVSLEGSGLQRGDTLVVQAGKVLRLGEPMGDLRLQGVQRSAIGDSVAARVARYYKGVVSHATPLFRVSLSGAVRAPGFYYARADTPLSDFIMRSGGQDQSADLSTTIVRRGQQTLWSAADVQMALRDGVTLDGLNLDPGDEIVVGTRESSAWPKLLQYGVPIASAIVLPLVLRH